MFNNNSLQLYSIYSKTRAPEAWLWAGCTTCRDTYTSLLCLLGLPILHELQHNIAFNLKILFGRNGCHTILLFVKWGDAIIFPLLLQWRFYKDFTLNDKECCAITSLFSYCPLFQRQKNWTKGYNTWKTHRSLLLGNISATLHYTTKSVQWRPARFLYDFKLLQLPFKYTRGYIWSCLASNSPLNLHSNFSQNMNRIRCSRKTIVYWIWKLNTEIEVRNSLYKLHSL